MAIRQFNLQTYLITTLGSAVCHSTDIRLAPMSCRGYMSKLGAVRKNWKRRWVVLDLETHTISYFVNDQEKNLKGVIDISERYA